MKNIFLFFSLSVALAYVPVTSRAEGFGINATRLIYPGDSGSIGVSVRNTQQHVPYLVQANISEKQDSITSSPFIVMPPIFRLEPQSMNQLKISFSGKSLPQDRESVFYFHAAAVPASTAADPTLRKNDVQANVRFGVGSIIKLFYRPAGISGTAYSAQKKLIFTRHENELRVMNSSPYFVSLASVTVNGKMLSLNTPEAKMLSPFAGYTWSMISKLAPGSRIEWKAINDNGGIDAFDAALP